MESGERQIIRLLGNIEATQKAILDKLQEHVEDDKERFKDLQERTAAIEKKINYAAGAVMVISAALTIAWQHILERFK